MPIFKVWIKKTIHTPTGPMEIGLGGEHDVHCESHQIHRERLGLYQAYREELERLIDCELTGTPLIPPSLERKPASPAPIPLPDEVSLERSRQVLAELHERLARRGREREAALNPTQPDAEGEEEKP